MALCTLRPGFSHCPSRQSQNSCLCSMAASNKKRGEIFHEAGHQMRTWSHCQYLHYTDIQGNLLTPSEPEVQFGFSLSLFRYVKILAGRVNCGMTIFRLVSYDWGSFVFTDIFKKGFLVSVLLTLSGLHHINTLYNPNWAFLLIHPCLGFINKDKFLLPLWMLKMLNQSISQS